METALSIIASNNPLAIIALMAVVVVYGIITYQRNTTAKIRNNQNNERKYEIEQLQIESTSLKQETAKMKEELHIMNTEKQLMQKDIGHLFEENSTVKDDIRAIKETLNNIQISIQKIGAYYDFVLERRKKND